MSLPLGLISHTLQTTPQTLAVLLADVDDAVLNWRPAASEWSIKEVIGHLIACDDHAFARRIALMLREENPELPWWDMAGAVEERQDNRRSLASLLEELAQPRPDHIARLQQLTAAQLARPCRARVGTITIGDFAVEWAYHDYNHLAQIATNLKNHFLPFMGETMRGAVS